MLKILKDRKNIFLILGFIFINMTITISTSDLFTKIKMSYSRAKFESGFELLQSDENISFTSIENDLDNVKLYGILNYPQFQMTNNEYIAISFIATNDKNLKQLDSLKIKGNVFSEDDINLGNKKIIIPKEFEKFIQQKDDKKMFYINGLNDWFEVIGIIESSGLFNNIIIPHKNLENISSKEYSIMVTKKTETLGYSFYPIETPSLTAIIKTITKSYKENITSMILGIIMALSTLIVFVVIWADENKTKFKIFKLVGFSNENLLKYIFKKIFILGVLGLIITIILSMLIPILKPMSTSIIGIPIILTCFVFISIISLIVTICALRQVLLFTDIKE